jgi:arylsulfatase A-like enzyme
MSFLSKNIGRLILLSMGVAGALTGALLGVAKPNEAVSDEEKSPESSRESSTHQPNFLVFIIDDLEVELMQRLLAVNQLPNIRSKIVDGAVNFQNAIVPTSICTPSRASFLTGKFAHNHGAWHVIGTEGPHQFDNFLNSNGDAYLPTWLGANYFRAFVGKMHLGNRNPNWNFFRPVEGYDARPCMYKVREGGTWVMPPVYQTKYIGDAAKQAIRSAGNKPFFAVVAPIAVHVNVANWRKMDSYANNTYTGAPVAFAQFRNQSTNTWRQHLVTTEPGPSGPVHKWWARDSALRDAGWGAWTFSGNDIAVAPNTGNGSVVGWNVLQPAGNTRRQQLVKSTGGPNASFYTRDIVDGRPADPWSFAGNQSILGGTGNAPVAAWSAVAFPSGLIRQQVVRGDEANGYASYIRHRLSGPGTFTPWRPDPDWGESVVFGRLCGFNLVATSGVGFIVQLVQQRPGSTNYEWWQSPELVDFQELAQMGNNPGASRKSPAARIADEGKMLNFPFMKGTHRTIDSRSNELESRESDGPSTTVSEVHPYYMMRAYAEGSWSPIAPGQTYNWSGNLPAGRFRLNRDPHGFEASQAAFDLPIGKSSFNQQRPNSLPFYSTATWPDLQDRVWGNKKQQDYLRRLYLDRMEQMLSIDKMVGEVIDAAGPNTIIIFTSDNGHINGEQRLSNKLTPHEESIRVPLYIKVPGGQRRQVSQLVANIDLAPTILDYAGLPWSSPTYKVDGRSLRPLITTGTATDWRRSMLIEFHKPRGQDFPATDWRFGLPDYLGLREVVNAPAGSINTLYVQYYGNSGNPASMVAYELYNMNADPFQTNNLTQDRLVAMDRLIRDFYSASGETVREQESSGIITT